MSAISKRVVRELRDKEFRDEYVASRVKRWIAAQIRTMRIQTGREWSQDELAEKLDTAQSNVSRLESPDYGKYTLQTLLDVASAFDVALQVRFVEHTTFLTATSDLTPDRLTVDSYGPRQEAIMARLFQGESRDGVRLDITTSDAGGKANNVFVSTNKELPLPPALVSMSNNTSFNSGVLSS